MMLKRRKSKSRGVSYSLGVGFESSEVSCFSTARVHTQPVCVSVCLYAPTASCWSPGSCLTRRKLLTDIWARGKEYTWDSAALEFL